MFLTWTNFLEAVNQLPTAQWSKLNPVENDNDGGLKQFQLNLGNAMINKLNTYDTAYKIKESSEKEQLRIQSIKLLVFKIARHKEAIDQCLKPFEEVLNGKKVIKYAKLENIL